MEVRNDLADIFQLLKQKADDLREKRPITFLQIGACGGVVGDPIQYTMEDTDHGILIEPSPIAFKMLLENKPSSKYPNYTFHNFAILPNKFIDRDLIFYQQVLTPEDKENDREPLGNNFIPGKKLHGCEFTLTKVDKRSLEKFLDSLTVLPDFLIVDAEGMDIDIILEYLDYDQPQAILFESWDLNWDNRVDFEIDFALPEVLFDKLYSLGYSIMKVGDNYLAYK